MNLENEYVRGPFASLINNMVGHSWVYNANVWFPGRDKKALKEDSPQANKGYEAGRPDGFVFANGKVKCVECKADMGSFCFDGVSPAQINWYQKVCLKTHTPYFVMVGIYQDFVKTGRNFEIDKWCLFLVPMTAFLILRDNARQLYDLGTLPLIMDNWKINSAGAKKGLSDGVTILATWLEYKLQRVGSAGQVYRIPEDHVWWRV